MLYSTPGFVPHWNAIQNYTRNIVIVCKKDYTKNILSEMLIKCIPWNQKLTFCAIDRLHVTPAIEKFVTEKKMGDYTVDTYIQFELDHSVFLEKLKTLPTTLPEGKDEFEKHL